MKKAALTLAIILTFGMTTAFAQDKEGLFGRGDSPRMEGTNAGEPSTGLLVPQLGSTKDQTVPLCDGMLVLTGLGALYLTLHKKKDTETH